MLNILGNLLCAVAVRCLKTRFKIVGKKIKPPTEKEITTTKKKEVEAEVSRDKPVNEQFTEVRNRKRSIIFY